MARIRMIKPEFFTDDFLGELPPLARILFAGLWCYADREGRLEDKPKRLKIQILPYDDCNVDELLDMLATGKDAVIIRYEVNGEQYIQVVSFTKHQHCHVKELASRIPPPVQNEFKTGLNPVQNKFKTPASSSTITSSSMAEEEFKLTDKESAICQLVQETWGMQYLTPNGPGWDSVVTISQYADEAIHEAFAAVKTNKVRRNNWGWILERLRNPERYGVKVIDTRTPEEYNRDLEINNAIGIIKSYKKQIEHKILKKDNALSCINEVKEYFSKYGDKILESSETNMEYWVKLYNDLTTDF